MTEVEVHGWLVSAVLIAAVATFLILLFVAAPYGRHTRKGWGPRLPYRMGWIVMESPAIVVFTMVYAAGRHRGATVPLLLAGLWMLHYMYRTLVYPFRVRARGKSTPAVIVASGFAFNVVNAYLNARWITELGPYENRVVFDPWLISGVLLFLSGWLLNQHSDHLLIRLRRPGDDGYCIPHGGGFRWVTCPNYLGEIVEWLGFALAAGSGAALAFALFTIANLAPRALAHDRWYRERFPDYPAERKALVPFLV